MYKNKYRKALTFSFDDGTIFDKRLIELFNKYGMKCTFNLNSGKMTHADNWVNKNVIILWVYAILGHDFAIFMPEYSIL